MAFKSGRHFLQIPGPTNIPERVLRAIDSQVIDHRGPKFAELAKECLADLKPLFKTTSHVVIYPASGTGAWEAALTNTLSPGDKILMFETGQFATLWEGQAQKLGLTVDFVPGDWRHGIDPDVVEEKLRADKKHEIRAVCAVHNETSTGVTSRISEVRAAIDRAKHPALLFVDAISSLGSMDYQHDEWQVDVTIVGSQKGMMLPPGLSFNAISAKALHASQTAKFPKSYWEWQPMITANESGFFPYTPATNLFYGMREALAMLREEGLENVFRRHTRHGEATRAAVRAWGLELNCLDERECSNSVTAVLMPPGHDEIKLRAQILNAFDMSLGAGLGKVRNKVFRIGHLGDFNDLTLCGALAGVEMGLGLAGVPHQAGGVAAAMKHLGAAATKNFEAVATKNFEAVASKR